ncbi:hypothetical protein F8S09_09025 [Deinococcus sp. SDU3-2]|uniref:Peptidase M50 domain-containing protein n=1 Tax=Deinococcus terrestris TaxID=2651870 RepID=A0A7X1NW47_9DEIO|nr:site-2 protease family protein [Deinococcus terrestris]MPY66830.1 hypothetical protein [Deinococcus terrestris]
MTPKPPRTRSPLTTVLSAVGGGLLGFFIGDALFSSGAPLWAVLLGLALGWPLQVLVHELGHAWFGRRVGLHLRVLGIGPVSWWPQQRRWRRSRVPALGFAYMMPPPGLALDDLARRYRHMIAGGPLVGLLFSVACAALALAAQGNASTVLWTVAGVGLLLNLVSALPLTGPGLLPDGARWRRLRPGSATARPEAALLALAAAAIRQRPRDWPPELLAALHAPLFDATARQYRAQVAADHGDLEGAARHLEDALALTEGQPPLLRAGFLAEQAYVSARRGDAAAARAALSAVPATPLLPDSSRARAEAVILLAEGRHAEVPEVLARGRAALDDPLCPHGVEEAWLGELEAALLPAPPARTLST